MPAPIRVVMLDLLSMVPYYTGHLCAKLAASGTVQVTLAATRYRHDPGFFRRQGVHNDPGLLDAVSRLERAPDMIRRPLKLLEYLINLAALLVRFLGARPDVIHVQFLPLTGHRLPIERWWLGAARALGSKVVYTVHNVLPQDGGDGCREAYRRVYGLADRLVCHDPEAAARLATEFGIPPTRISVIPHGPMFDGAPGRARGEVRKLLGVGDDECLVLWQGILRPYKGVPFLLRAWRIVASREPRGRLAIVGGGDRRLARAVQDQTLALGIQSRVRLELRFVPIEELAGYFEAADVLVYPYREITGSGALMTGIGRGKAVVASALPAFERLLRDGDTALLVRYGDVDALAASLVRLIGDPALRRQLGGRLKECQSRLPGWTEIARQTSECYRAAIWEAPALSTEPLRT